MSGRTGRQQAQADQPDVRSLVREELNAFLSGLEARAQASEPQQPREAQESPFTAEQWAQLSGKPGLKAQAELAALAFSRLSSAKEALQRGDVDEASERVTEVCDAAATHIEFLKVWLAHGPEPARKWAELMGMSRPATLFADPAKQAALEKALKECQGSGSGAAKRKQPDSAAKQQWLKKAACRFCGVKGHFARDCPNGGATQKGPRPPM